MSQPKNILQFSREVVEKNIERSLKNKKNKIGQGGEANVWKIIGTDYCVRIPFGSERSFKGVLNLNISDAEKINHTVAKLKNGVSIMPIIKGFTFDSEEVKQSEVATMIENMPQKSFDELVHQLFNAVKYHLMPDIGLGNIIINPSSKKMTAIDFCSSEYYSSEKQLLSIIFRCLNPTDMTTPAQKKKCAQKLLFASLNIAQKKQNSDIDLSYCGYKQFITHLSKLIHSKQRSADLYSNLDKITKLSSNSSINQNKNIELKQLLENTTTLIDNMFKSKRNKNIQ